MLPIIVTTAGPSDTLACHHKNVTCVLRIHVQTRHSYAHSKAPFTLTTAREMPAHPLDSSLQIVSSIVDSWMSKDWSPTDFFLSLHWISQWYYRYRSTMEYRKTVVIPCIGNTNLIFALANGSRFYVLYTRCFWRIPFYL